jgi:hypothetical protein
MSDRAVCMTILTVLQVALLWQMGSICRRRWEDTISARLLAASRENPLIGYTVTGALCLMAGILIGHWFWAQKG